ncbi:MAG: hypothetical protein DSM106950_45765 [Stigonema ocellatum SAG 48.90 = DSM 106950]|nr:hypothetical protein [Stigonema ocellatum SAG 48.90 = DSM 106950]
MLTFLLKSDRNHYTPVKRYRIVFRIRTMRTNFTRHRQLSATLIIIPGNVKTYVRAFMTDAGLDVATVTRRIICPGRKHKL